MAILATSRKWLVTSLCAASRSPCSRQRLASMNSSCGSSIGNRRISSRYRVRPVSPDKMGSAAVWAMTAPSIYRPPRMRRAIEAVALRADGAVSIISHPQHTRSNQPSGRETGITSARWWFDFRTNGAENPREIPKLTARLVTASAGPTPDQRIMQTDKIRRQFRPELKDFASQRMLKAQDMGMQRLPAKVHERCLRLVRQKRRLGAKAGPIDRIAEQREADRGQLPRNLMGPAGSQPARQRARHRLRAAGLVLSRLASRLGGTVAFQHLP